MIPNFFNRTPPEVTVKDTINEDGTITRITTIVKTAIITAEQQQREIDALAAKRIEIDAQISEKQKIVDTMTEA